MWTLVAVLFFHHHHNCEWHGLRQSLNEDYQYAQCMQLQNRPRQSWKCMSNSETNTSSGMTWEERIFKAPLLANSPVFFQNICGYSLLKLRRIVRTCCDCSVKAIPLKTVWEKSVYPKHSFLDYLADLIQFMTFCCQETRNTPAEGTIKAHPLISGVTTTVMWLYFF